MAKRSGYHLKRPLPPALECKCLTPREERFTHISYMTCYSDTEQLWLFALMYLRGSAT
jgi:hypothetical protein